MEFSLCYFASYAGGDAADRYRLLTEGARFADRSGFTAVWTPERHFGDFGGLYPNPSLTSAALATITERVQLRAGSVVLPLHDPIRVVEEWSVVDNLSRGRVGVSVASGWHATDFVLAPQHYERRRAVMREGIETVRRLWSGGSVRRPGGSGQEVEVRTLPRPVQAELPLWITAAGSPDTFRLAGELGAGLLTHLLGQSVEQLAGKVRAYREAWRGAGHGPGTGHVTVMLHTYLGEDPESVLAAVREPLGRYLRSSLDLMGSQLRELGHGQVLDELSEDEAAAVLEYARARYLRHGGLVGTEETCAEMVARLRGIGVDELACLIDFGLDTASVLAGLERLAALSRRMRALPVP